MDDSSIREAEDVISKALDELGAVRPNADQQFVHTVSLIFFYCSV